MVQRHAVLPDHALSHLWMMTKTQLKLILFIWTSRFQWEKCFITCPVSANWWRCFSHWQRNIHRNRISFLGFFFLPGKSSKHQLVFHKVFYRLVHGHSGMCLKVPSANGWREESIVSILPGVCIWAVLSMTLLSARWSSDVPVVCVCWKYAFIPNSVHVIYVPGPLEMIVEWGIVEISGLFVRICG